VTTYIPTQTVTTVYDLAAGDYLEVFAYQDSGGALNVQTNANYSPEFSMVLVAPALIAVGTGSGAGYGTSFPGSPVDGQEHVLVDSVTAPTYIWRFRYNASFPGASKWEFVGGSPWTSYVSATETTTSTTSVDLATVQQLAAPRDGVYIIEFVGTFNMGSPVNSGFAELFVAGVNKGAGIGNVATVGKWQNAAIRVVQTVTAGQVMKVMFRNELASSTASWTPRTLSITPVRVT
jgi:hypothetical protein